ncbi:MAG: hypothetical protein H6586_09690 [Flavobacteriales bacterium]|nr:hypothetical protein [Flavobacteriales bacterium]
MKQVNRLVIIGNGFDLANGLNTTYEDFLLDYLKEAFEFTIQNKETPYSDELIEILVNKKSDILVNEEFNSIKNLKRSKNIDIFHGFIPHTGGRKDYSIKIKSRFFNVLLKQNKWADIEFEYFKELISYIKEANEGTYGRLRKLNNEFLILKNRLIEYVKKQDFDREIYSRTSRVIESSFAEIEYEIEERFFKSRVSLKNIWFLNFNYTNVLSDYIPKTSKDVNIIQIHGSVYEPNSVVFGYGDDTYPKYSEIEEIGIDDFNHFIILLILIILI